MNFIFASTLGSVLTTSKGKGKMSISEEQRLAIYRQNALDLWDANSGEVFSNGRSDHAAVLYETFLTKAETEILMLFVICRKMFLILEK